MRQRTEKQEKIAQVRIVSFRMFIAARSRAQGCGASYSLQVMDLTLPVYVLW